MLQEKYHFREATKLTRWPIPYSILHVRVVFEVPFQLATSNSRYFPSMRGHTTEIKQYQQYITSASVT